jgi:hypothetical protein
MSHRPSGPDRIDIRPVAAFHGTTGEFDAFGDEVLGTASGHPSSSLGHFFSASSAVATIFCLHEDLVDRAYDTHYGSRSLLDRKWLQRHCGEDGLLSGAGVLEVELRPSKVARISAVDFGARCDDGVSEESWVALRNTLKSQGYDAVLVSADEPAVSRGELCAEYLADTWIVLDPETIRIVARHVPAVRDPVPSP